MPDNIGIFYGSSTCYTEFVAERIQEKLGAGRADLFNIANCNLQDLPNYDVLLFGIPTWDYGELQEDWETIWDALDEISLQGTTCAIFGLGDQVGYADWFQDAVGYLYYKLQSMGATLIGQWPTQGYEFDESKGLNDAGDMFLGLALDEENQPELTDTRIDQWLTQVLSAATAAC